MSRMQFDEKDELIRGRVYTCTASEFIDVFCYRYERRYCIEAISNIFDYATSKGAKRIFVGGSFITTKKEPRDFDCVIVFNDERSIPDFYDTSKVGGIDFDILYASEDQRHIIDSYIDLFQSSRNGVNGNPVVEILLVDNIDIWTISHCPSETERQIIRDTYASRTILERRKARGVLFTIHGVNTNAYWNSKFAPLACSQGWIFAPFIYENPRRLLICPSLRKKTVEQFGDYLYEISTKYKVENASIVAHSFGTYIIAKYLLDHACDDSLPIKIDSIILAGSIVSEDYNWKKHEEKIGCILNISSPNDKWVKKMPESSFLKSLMREKDGIFGRIGYTGIKNTDNDYIFNKEIPTLDHCNVFKDEVLERYYITFLNSKFGTVARKLFK